jgi:molybdopterin converting factor small subunit
MNALSYNTERAQLHIPEYGRNVQNMIDHAKRIESREERNRAVRAIIDVMGQLNPHLRDVEDYTHKLWTHLYIMSDFEIDVDSPYPIPEPEKLRERPKDMKYPKNKSKYGHFGHYTEEMIKVASEIEDEEEKKYMTDVLANLLKKNYLTFHTENVENGAIVQHLKELSKGKLKVENPESLTPTKQILKQFGIAAPVKQQKKGKGKKRRK